MPPEPEPTQETPGQPAEGSTPPEGSEGSQWDIRPVDGDVQPDSAGEPEGEPLFVARTQQDLDKKFGETRDEGRNSVLKDLGFEDFDSLKGIVDSHNQQAEADKTELQKAQEAQQATQAENDQLLARVFETEVRQQIRASGVGDEAMSDVLALVDLDAVDVDESGNLTGLDDQLSGLSERIPSLFEGAQPRRAPSMASGAGNGSGGSPGSGVSEEAFDNHLRRMGLGGG